MNTRRLFLLALLLCLSSWLLARLADFNAGYLLLRNAGEPGVTWAGYAASHRDELWAALVPGFSDVVFFPVFLLPSLAMVAFRGSGPLQYGALGLIALVTALDLSLLLAFDGGDYKGCDSCLLSYALHLLGSIPAAVFIVAGFVAQATQPRRDVEQARN